MIGGAVDGGSRTRAASGTVRRMTEVLLRDELLARVGGRWALDAALRRGDWRRVLRGT